MLEGTEGLDHIQSQTRWNEGKAAFIPSGSWLENEQKKVAPEGFATTVAPTPLMDGAKLPFQSTRVSAAEAFIVPAKAKNIPGGQEYLRIMLSKEGASKFTELTAAPTVVTGAGEGIELTPAAASATELVKAGGDNNWNYYFFVWYSPMRPKIETAFGELAAGRVTADEFCAAVPESGRRDREGPADQEAHAQLAARDPPPGAREGVRCDTVRPGSSWGSWSCPWRCTPSS